MDIICLGTLSPQEKNCTTKKRKPQANAISCLYWELFRRPYFRLFSCSLCSTGAHNGTHISRSNTRRARASIFRSSQKGQEGRARRGRGKKHLRYELLVFTSLFHTIKTYTLSHVRIGPALQAAGQTFDIIYCVYRCYGRGIKRTRARCVAHFFFALQRGERKYCSGNPVY